ncbi:tautomerase family protein [Ralstonia solanacearum]|uniref:Tautomerase family protein n=2 Tax=Ralstonia solanacearum TaxID=305 RepID=A0AAW5ZSQ1_RALSL|nr:tautomerase family protein [Ralstonia solanacearum]AYB53412.1 tautomerase family protein [Ralstonia solanacearum]AYB57952.1 tautomerase family protein [Ralstonia solanacearum]MDB0511627.1 tautomerase family protein [Ralstonia solanacearum]MDB0516041.1 tautomerase family protein [Ralstonia solanacearum]MDB0529284.1 tautomerase family protein [Ralstonia solanacearum]
MPFLKFDIIQGRSEEQVRKLLDATHQAMVQAFDVPSSDRYQCVTQHRPGELVLEDTGLGYTRSNDVVVLTVISRSRTEAQKVEFYRLLAQNLQASCGLSPDDLIVALVENTDADWSFGRGRAQFLTKEL